MADVDAILKKYWGYDSFRGSQESLIRDVLRGEDVIGLMPTGGGKSLCYQVPALAMEGICVVVSPLIALMEDQLEDLKTRGVRAMGLYGRLTEEDLLRRLDNAAYGNYKFLYLSPERLLQDLVLQHLERMKVCLVAVDEAHCVSQWGFDFRPAYLEINRLRSVLPGVPALALTATATPEVQQDIREHLGLEGARMYRDSFLRENIRYAVKITEDKRYRLRSHLESCPGSAIVYVRTRRATVALSNYLEQQGVSSGAFHGGLPQETKRASLRAWQAGELRVMVATNAFGMGIDKSDVRSVVHYEIPETPEHYYQEAGRAGRDGQEAAALLLATPGDLESTPDYFLGNLPSVPELIRVYRKLNTFFGIPYGEIPESPLPFRFEEFCEQYGLPAGKTFTALEILDRQGVLTLLQVFKTTVKMNFICSKSGLWRYLETYPDMKATIQTLLRTYGGLFDFETPVRSRSLARKLGISESVLLDRFRQMEKDGLVELQIRQGDMEIHFLQPREDDRTIHAFGKSVNRRMEVRAGKVGAMLDYVRDVKTCRQVLLLQYFGETDATACGHCDTCRDRTLRGTDSGIRSRILRELGKGPRTSRELCVAGCQPETQLLHCLQYLLEEGRLRLDNQNQYTLT